MTSVIFWQDRVINNDLLCQVKIIRAPLSPLRTRRKGDLG
jgi:hypothetical protein